MAPTAEKAPAAPVAVPVTPGVVGRRRRDSLVGQRLGDGAEAAALLDVHPEDALYNGRRQRIDFQPVRDLPGSRLGRIRKRTVIDEHISVRGRPPRKRSVRSAMSAIATFTRS